MNLFRRIAITSLLPLIILLAILSVQSINQYRTNVRNSEHQDTIHALVILDRLQGLERELVKAASLVAESKDSTRAVREHDLDYLFHWSRRFHSTFLDRIIITDETGTVLVRSDDQFRFSDRLSGELPVNKALSGHQFWGLIEFDGTLSFVFSRPVLLYGEIPVGTVSVCAGLGEKMLAYMSDSHTVGVEIGSNWPESAEEKSSDDIRVIRQFKTDFYPYQEETGSIALSFYKTEATKQELRNSIITIGLLITVILVSLILSYLLLSNYVRPYSSLMDSLANLVRKDVDYAQLRQKLAKITGDRNREAGRIAESLLEYTFVIEKDISILEDSAYRDPLTGLHNRRYCSKIFAWEFNRHRKEGGTLSLIMADIDHFKLVNDFFGHRFGDEVLAGVSDIISHVSRGTDIAIRWGGEEFMLLCPFTDLEGCRILAEKLRQSVEESIIPLIHEEAEKLGIDFSDEDLPVGTLSLGCAVVLEHSEGNWGYEAADKALYAAKENGRNRVEVNE